MSRNGVLGIVFMFELVFISSISSFLVFLLRRRECGGKEGGEEGEGEGEEDQEISTAESLNAAKGRNKKRLACRRAVSDGTVVG